MRWASQQNPTKTWRCSGRFLFSVSFFPGWRLLIPAAHFAELFSGQPILGVMFFDQFPMFARYRALRPSSTERLSCIDLHDASSHSYGTNHCYQYGCEDEARIFPIDGPFAQGWIFNTEKSAEPPRESSKPVNQKSVQGPSETAVDLASIKASLIILTV